MNSFGRFGLVALAIILAGGAAVPVSQAQSRVFSDAIQFNTTGAYLGIQMDDVTASNMAQYKLSSERGVIVRSVAKGSPAESAGLRENDVLLEYAGTPVWSSSQFSRLVQETPPGRKVELAVNREGKRVNLTAQIGTRDGGRQSEGRGGGGAPEDPFGWNFRDFPFRDLYPVPGNRRAPEPEAKPRLGVTLQPLTDQLGEFLGVPGKKGALIASVIESSPSAGKLKSGDVVVGADGKEIREPEDLTRVVREKAEGALTLKVIRDKKEISVIVNLPAAASTGDKGGIKL